MSTIPQTAPLSFADSRSCQVLSAACLREGCARQLYLASAQAMEDAGLYVLAHALRFTAAQEQEHEAIFLGLLATQGAAAPVLPQGAAPSFPADPAELLDDIIRSEAEDAEQRYPQHACIAAQEGYPRIAAAFRRIAETEDLHARRFRQYARALEEGTLFRDACRVSWLCLGCGEFHADAQAPDSCAACGRSQGYFIRSNHFPFLVEG